MKAVLSIVLLTIWLFVALVAMAHTLLEHLLEKRGAHPWGMIFGLAMCLLWPLALPVALHAMKGWRRKS
jgi:hypothetical protein